MNTTTTLTPNEAAFVGGFMGTFGAIMIAWVVLVIIGGWKMLKKAGEPGWKILIPFYNIYVLYKIAGMKNWFWATLIVPIVCSFIVAGLGVDPSMSDVQLQALITEKPVIAVVAVVEGIFSLWIYAMYAIRTSRAFGHGGGYAVGIFFLSSIFMMILGFGSSKYDKKVLKK